MLMFFFSFNQIESLEIPNDKCVQPAKTTWIDSINKKKQNLL